MAPVGDVGGVSVDDRLFITGCRGCGLPQSGCDACQVWLRGTRRCRWAGCRQSGDSCMRMLKRAAHGGRVLAGALLFAGTVAGISPASASAAGPVAGRPGAVASLIAKGILSGVAASSA